MFTLSLSPKLVLTVLDRSLESLVSTAYFSASSCNHGVALKAVEQLQVSMLTEATEETMVKVPQMAESISEGTLKQFNKREKGIS